jgi:plastocyanin
MMRTITIRSSLFVLSCLLLYSCNTPVAKAAPKLYTVEIKQMQFQPAELQLHRGDTVLFVNRDMVDHNVTEEAQKAWSSSALATGKSWKLVPTQSASYYCTIHQVMKGKLVVQ